MTTDNNENYKTIKDYRSPPARVIHSLATSNSRLKEKNTRRKNEMKRLSVKVRDVEESRDKWKAEAKRLAKELETVKEMQKEQEKKSVNTSIDSVLGSYFSLNVILASVRGLLNGGFGFRGVTRMLNTTKQFIQSSFKHHSDGIIQKIPCYNTVKNWILKIGTHMLERPKRQGNHWAIIFDKTIQMGPDKCLVVLGVDLNKLNPDNLTLSHKDLEPLAITVSKSCPGETVCEALQQAVKKTGGYCQLLTDGGSDLSRGIRLFENDKNSKKHFFDITHKIGLFMKASFEKDGCWKQLMTEATTFTQKIKLSVIAHLAPPRLRLKSSILNIGQFVLWGCKLFDFFEKGIHRITETKLIEDNCKWIRNYGNFLKDSLQIVRIADAVKNLVHKKGYCALLLSQFDEMIAVLQMNMRPREFVEQLRSFIKSECMKVPQNEFRLGSTDILESIFGKFKWIEKQYNAEGFTSLVGTIPALMGQIDEKEITEAMKNYKVKEIRKLWGEDGSGGSYIARRRQDLRILDQGKFNLDIYSLREDLYREFAI